MDKKLLRSISLFCLLLFFVVQTSALYVKATDETTFIKAPVRLGIIGFLPEKAQGIFNQLQLNKVFATVFMTDSQIIANNQLPFMILASGQQLGLCFDSYSMFSNEKLLEDLNMLKNRIYEITGLNIHIFSVTPNAKLNINDEHIAFALQYGYIYIDYDELFNCNESGLNNKAVDFYDTVISNPQGFRCFLFGGRYIDMGAAVAKIIDTVGNIASFRAFSAAD